jgi:hypothetical protein
MRMVYLVLLRTVCTGGVALAASGVCDTRRMGLFFFDSAGVVRGSNAGEASGGTFDDAAASGREASLDIRDGVPCTARGVPELAAGTRPSVERGNSFLIFAPPTPEKRTPRCRQSSDDSISAKRERRASCTLSPTPPTPLPGTTPPQYI